MDSCHPAGPGFADGPLTPENYKRGVYRPPPSKFTVEMLGASKQGGSYCYGMRISPINGDRSSVSSRGASSDYVVWRRWEDCLWFQGNLELEYRRMARSKRQRLLRGKGVRKDGFYKQDQASSFESLPPGPDPSSVARDIHEHIPMLTKKGTVFRASQATIDQRASELKALVEGLLQDEVPALVDELRNSRIVTDFFGFWRRDYDLYEKQRPRNQKARTSVTSSVFSMYFSASNPNIHNYPPERAPSTLRSVTTLDTDITIRSRSRKSSSDSSDVSPSRSSRPRASSTASSDFSSTQSERSLDSPTSTTSNIPSIVDDSPVLFDHNPHRRSYPSANERPTSALAVLPEDREVCLKDTTYNTPPHTRRRRKSSADETRSNRNGRIFTPSSSACESEVFEGCSLNLPDRIMRESWQTIDSASCILDGIGMIMPGSPNEYSHRSSMSSVATFMTNCSADAVIRSPSASSSSTSNYTHTSPLRPRVSCPVSISEDDDNLWSDPDDDILDTYLADSFPLPCFDIPDLVPENRPETPHIHVHDQRPTTHSFKSVPRSPTTSTAFSVSTVSPVSDMLAIKAGYNNSIIMLRVPCDISYKEMRQRLYSKFVGQEGIPLAESFTISFLQPIQAPSVSPPPARTRSNSLSSDADKTQVHCVTSQSDWENVTASLEGNKLTLRISDNTPSS